MPRRLDLAALLSGCADDSFDDGIRIDSDLEPLAGPGGAIKPAVYEYGAYQFDRRWAFPDDGEPTQVIIIDNMPSQANRLEEALRRSRESTSIPEFVLDLSTLPRLPGAPAPVPVESPVPATAMRTPTFATRNWRERIFSRPRSAGRSSRQRPGPAGP